MVLNFIDFLLGGKKTKKPVKNANPAQPINGSQGVNVQPQQGGVPNVQNNPNVGSQPVPQQQPPVETQPQEVSQPDPNAAQDGSTIQFQDSNSQQNAPPQQQQVQPQPDPTYGSNTINPGAPSQGQGEIGKSRLGEVVTKIQEDVRSMNEKFTTMVTDIKSLENEVNTIGNRVDELDNAKNQTNEKLSEIDGSMTKFLSLYEIVNNQYNPFVDKDSLNAMPKKRVVVGSDGNTIEGGEQHELGGNGGEGGTPHPDFSALKSGLESIKSPDDIFLELDTLNIEEAAGDAVPLTQLKNNTNSLVTILSWLEYLIKKVGIEEARNTLRYYTEVLRWITPEVFFDMDKYLKGMKDKETVSETDRVTVKDHIVSLYFISKLNEKSLDERLTKAVLQIIKQ